MIALVLAAAALATASPAPTGPATSAPATAVPLIPVPAVSATAAAPVPTAAVRPTSTGAPTLVPAPPAKPNVPTPTPTESAIVYNYRFVPVAPKDPEAPRIFAVYMNDKVLHAPGPIDIRIDTAPDAVKVIEITGKKSYAIPMVAPGRFVSSSMLPKVPIVAHGITVMLRFQASNAAGKTTDVQVPFNIK